MTLSEYLSREGIKAAHFAKTLGVEPSTIHRLLNGSRKPGWDLADRITKETAGSVTIADFARARSAA